MLGFIMTPVPAIGLFIIFMDQDGRNECLSSGQLMELYRRISACFVAANRKQQNLKEWHVGLAAVSE